MNATRNYTSRMKSSQEYGMINSSNMFYSSMEQSMSKDLFENNSNAEKNNEDKKTTSETGKNQNELLKPITGKRAEQVQTIQRNLEKMSIRRQILTQLLKALFGNNKELYDKIQETMNSEYGFTENQTNFVYESYEEYLYEEESTSISTTGTAMTADGREIQFDIEVSMSRTFEGYFQSGHTVCMDPLVINTGSSVTEIGTQSFFFDLDVDGELDEISTLAGGSGFLALDKNDDGIINDGSELFGALSGDGFADLAAYDLDHNGWIDEADEVFSKLKIWYADGSETPKLMSLKEAGVGAIALKNVDSQFSLTNGINETNAYIRKTGMFLYEDGMAGTIQHVDLVKKGA